jgi:aminoglycoside N3'-acetyltransferase
LTTEHSSGLATSIDRMVRQLGQLGVSSGDVVMVHASLKAVGRVEQGGVGLIAALDRVLGRNGVSLMVIGARDDWAWVNERPEQDREALLADATPFDAYSTPAEPDVGMLAELFRCRPGTLVSNHPEGRFAARGQRAAVWLAEQPWDDYYGPGSPLERLVMHDGKILRLGADLNTVTALHYAEYLADLPNKRRVCRHRLVQAPNGPCIRRIRCLDDEDGIVDYPGEDYFATILSSYLDSGQASCGVVGAARGELIDAAALVRHAVAWMNQHLA